MLNLGLKAEKPLQNENHTDDWALGSYPRDNGHLTKSSLTLPADGLLNWLYIACGVKDNAVFRSFGHNFLPGL